MAIVQVKSTNPSFSFVIKKNPHSGMLLRAVRKGMAYGWYTDEGTFNVYFKDADNEVSYKQHRQDQFEYLNVSRYNTPLFVLGAINEFFAAPLKAQDPKDTEQYEHSFHINMIHIELLRYIHFFEKHLTDYSFETVHLAHKSYSLTIKTQKSLYELMHVVSVLCLFLSIFSDEYIDISDDILIKYVKSIQIIDAPFYLRSLFARNFLASRDRFKKYKEELEKTERYSIQLAFGGTAQQRRSYIGSVLPFDKSIVDVGCGEGFYAIPFASKIEASYYAIDISEPLLEVVQRKAAAKELENIATFPSIDHFIEQYNGEQVDVVLTEVIEHMSLDEASALIRQICGQIDFDHFVLTTPNAEFNAYYELDDFRHDDHKWELGTAAFQEWLIAAVGEQNVDTEFVAIGDGVNGIQTTQGAILRKRRE
ncbi:bifunctional 2-polyprenyl-6-hydroxyphenol methylase/3-demethylubiquinol 3-O-methyltransferase UbiG [Bacillus sp. FJAT-26390]|uniref:class I SAM-dependent methyltransferase n=1 Tax=Bacillus sp. FJAT-26390 TaxID=1743142 RepID=UPI000807EAA0|nr:class I SAM-dependent methyltransferase [Bacillus sp. FJAT-26390]OBZ08738.1 methyltransferase [Bacillus sp. FJAT-26390]